jgi:hypothetical protein
MGARDSIHRIRSVELVPTDDAAYLAAMAEQALAHRRYGPREEQSATYRVSGRIEAAVRAWLGERVPLLAQRVIAAEVLYRDARRYESLYLELDVVEGRDGVPARIYEVKFTSNPAAALRAFGQLGRALRLLQSRFDDVDGLAVVVHGSRSGFDPADTRLTGVALLRSDMLATRPAPQRALLELELDELSSWLSEEEFALLDAAQDEGDANVAARQERARQGDSGDGEPRRPERERRPGATLTFDGELDQESASDSPFAALRGLVRPGGDDDGPA